MKTLFFYLPVVLLLYSCGSNEKQHVHEQLLLPVYGEKNLAKNESDTVYHTIADFVFVNQFGDSISQKTTEGKIYIADFFFATCQSICPVMSTQLTRVQDSCEKFSDVILLSHTVNPMHDTVEVLAEYGKKYGALKNKWHLLTGEKKKIYDLAKNSYLVNALQDDGSEEGFLHSETFLLIDKQRRLRGIYDGTDSLQVNKLIKDISILKTEDKK